MRTVLIGASGLLGSHLLFRNEVLKPSRDECDITNLHKIWMYTKSLGAIDNIVFCAAYTNVGKSNFNKKLVYDINVNGISNFIQALQDTYTYQNLPLLTYISTDYVFNGEIGNYNVSDPLDPVPNNYYALSKALGETVVRAYPNRQIIRTSFCRDDIWPYPLAFEDQFTSRDKISIIAPMISEAIDSCQIRTFHIGTQRKSVYDLALTFSKDVKPVSRLSIKDVYIPYDTSLQLSYI